MAPDPLTAGHTGEDGSASPWARPGDVPVEEAATAYLSRIPGPDQPDRPHQADQAGQPSQPHQPGPPWEPGPLPIRPELLPVVALPAREGLRGTLIVLGATALVLLGITAFGWSAQRSYPPVPGSVQAANPPSAVPPSPTDPARTAYPTPGLGGVYVAPGNLCEAADFTAFRPTFDQLGGLSSQSDGSAGFFQFAQCDGSTGNETVRGLFSFRVSVYADPKVARQEFDAARAGADGEAKTSTVGGVGTAAYNYLDPAVGPTVEIYDGNLRIRLSWGAEDRTAKAPDGTTTALIDVCESTMMLLRES